jgi:hypothetical protein
VQEGSLCQLLSSCFLCPTGYFVRKKFLLSLSSSSSCSCALSSSSPSSPFLLEAGGEHFSDSEPSTGTAAFFDVADPKHEHNPGSLSGLINASGLFQPCVRHACEHGEWTPCVGKLRGHAEDSAAKDPMIKLDHAVNSAHASHAIPGPIQCRQWKAHTTFDDL